MALAPLTLEIDNVFGIYECAEEIARFEEGDGTVRQDSRQLLPHDMICLPQRSLYGNASSHGVSLEGQLVLFDFEHGLGVGV